MGVRVCVSEMSPCLDNGMNPLRSFCYFQICLIITTKPVFCPQWELDVGTWREIELEGGEPNPSWTCLAANGARTQNTDPELFSCLSNAGSWLIWITKPWRQGFPDRISNWGPNSSFLFYFNQRILQILRVLRRNAAVCDWANANGSTWPKDGAFLRPTTAARRCSSIRWVLITNCIIYRFINNRRG